MHHSQQAFSSKKGKKRLTFMSLVHFWHEKNPVWIIASVKNVCPLKSRKAVILFWLVKGNMVMSHDSAGVWGSLADRQVFLFVFGLFVSLLCFATEYRNSCFSLLNVERQVFLLGIRRCRILARSPGPGGMRAWCSTSSPLPDCELTGWDAHFDSVVTVQLPQP